MHERTQKIRAFVPDAAKTDLPVLLLGETGTGKRLLARLIHQQSKRVEGSFVRMDLGTIPSSLIHSGLFGCTKGVFTGAQGHQGLVRSAHGGTLFLDEIGDVPLDVQACLLQLLEAKTVRALGSQRFDRVDCRFIAATRADLKAKVAEGSFREDLFFRLRGHVLHLAPLRDRGEDVLVVARRWLEDKTGARVRLSQEAEKLMLQHPWPGNFRELFHRLQASLSQCTKGTIEPEHLGLPATDPGLAIREDQHAHAKGNHPRGELVDRLVAEILAGRAFLPEILEELERKAIFLAMEKTGSLRAAARVLGLSHSSLKGKLEKHGENGKPSARF
ncbi:MAG: sigma 54-interacting transcriptional regulator [Thermoanaerobaculum sp.]